MGSSKVSTCPDSALLRRLEAGELSDEEADRLIPHVQQCPSCGRKVEEFRAHNLDARVIRSAAADGGYSTVSSGPTADTEQPRCDTGGGHVWDIPDYERVRLCGEGAFGSVWAVRNRVGVYRALKLIDLARLRAADVRCRESTALETYCRHVHRHPNLIEIFHVGVRGEMLYYTMELGDDDSTRQPVGDTLSETYRPLTLQRVMARGPISVDASIEIVLQLLRGLSSVHAMDLAHRDLKPANIVFVDKRPKVADIGMITTDTDSPSRVGTPDYMPPDGRMDLTGDVFALGRMLHQLTVGADPDDAPPLTVDTFGASDHWNMKSIQKVILTACAPAADGRYQRAEQMLEAIEACREMSYESLFAEIESTPRPPPAEPKHFWVPIVVALIHTLPWALALILAIVLARRLL